MKKTTIAILAVASAFAINSVAFAQFPPIQPSNPAVDQDLSNISNSINALPTQIANQMSSTFSSLSTFVENESTPHSLKHFLLRQWQQTIPDVGQIAQLNTATLTVPNTNKTLFPEQAAAERAKIETSNNLQNTLTQFFYSMNREPTNNDQLDTTIKTAEGQPFSQYLVENNLGSLTVNRKSDASDTLWTADINNQGRLGKNASLLKKPTELHNDYFDFASLITPIAYNNNQLHAAKQFVKYAAQSTQDITGDIDFKKFYADPAALANLKNNEQYQKFQFTMRSLMAIRSMIINSLDLLIAERTTVSGLGTTAGIEELTSQAGGSPQLTPVANASPLQVEAYQANHRIQNSGWYNMIENKTPATVQRETLIVLAEIEHQNYEAHLDRERILAALTALNLQMNLTTTNAILMQESAKMQAVIGGAKKAAQEQKAAEEQAEEQQGNQ